MVDESILQQAIELATHARMQAYAPYSGFRVGACVVDSIGGLHAGCNVENASYGLTQCAERSAITSATVSGHRDIVACVVVTDAEKPTAPCGACRQVLVECGTQLLVVSRTLSGREQRWQLTELLPSAFDGTSLESH